MFYGVFFMKLKDIALLSENEAINVSLFGQPTIPPDVIVECTLTPMCEGLRSMLYTIQKTIEDGSFHKPAAKFLLATKKLVTDQNKNPDERTIRNMASESTDATKKRISGALKHIPDDEIESYTAKFSPMNYGEMRDDVVRTLRMFYNLCDEFGIRLPHR